MKEREEIEGERERERESIWKVGFCNLGVKMAESMKSNILPLSGSQRSKNSKVPHTLGHKLLQNMVLVHLAATQETTTDQRSPHTSFFFESKLTNDFHQIIIRKRG